MRKALIFVFLLLCTGVQALFVPPTPPPMSKYPSYSEDAEEEIPDFIERHKGAMDTGDLYELGLLYILVHNNKKARIYLNKSVQSDPKLVDGWSQLGFLDIWEKKYLDAYSNLNRAFQLDPCNKYASFGLLQVGQQWIMDAKRRSETMHIFKRLYKCKPKDIDVVFFYARFLYEIGEYEKAERLAKKCLYLDDESKDAAYLLVNCYIKQEKWAEAREAAIKYLEGAEESKELGDVAQKKGDLSLAELRYRETLKQDKEEHDARLQLARILATQRKYKEAKKHYETYLEFDPMHERTLRELFEVKTYTNPSWVINYYYSEAKENDPTVNAPTAKDYYTYLTSSAVLPHPNNFSTQFDLIYYRQQEENIYNNTENYDAYLIGGEFSTDLRFADYWQWKVELEGFYAWSPNVDVNFPFDETSRFQPGTSLIFHKKAHKAAATVRIESQIIKNFQAIRSEALQQDTGEVSYAFMPDVYMHPIFFVAYNGMYYHGTPSNWRNQGKAEVSFGLPKFEYYLKPYVKFWYTTFNRLNQNYFTYDYQRYTQIGFIFRYDLNDRSTFNLEYNHQIQYSKNVFQPIGTFIFTSPLLLLNGNVVIARINYRIRDEFLINLTGEYFRNNLPYRSYTISTRLRWAF